MWNFFWHELCIRNTVSPPHCYEVYFLVCICVFAMLCLVTQLCHTLYDPWTIAHQAPLSMGILQARILEWGAMPYSGDLPNPGIKPRSPTLQEDSLPSEPPGKPRNTGVGSLPLLQGIFLTQESNWGLLHCRRILYHLSTREAHICVCIYICISVCMYICACVLRLRNLNLASI